MANFPVHKNSILRDRLDNLVRGDRENSAPLDVVVTPGEINDRHGTGPLVKRIMKGRRGVCSVRARDDWGHQNFGDWNVKIAQEGFSRPECFRNVLRVFSGRRVASVLCVPFLEDDLITSIVLKEAFGAILCGYVMDDQNVSVSKVPDALMREFLEKCSLRLATHPELQYEYQRKFGLPFSLLPAVVPDALISGDASVPEELGREHGALIGSFWDQMWFDRLCAELSQCQCRIDWYGNNQSPWLKFPPEVMESAGVTAKGLIPESRLAAELRRYSFVIVPVGILNQSDGNQGIAALSLPGRILFAAATSRTPILIVGSQDTCGARFVKHFGIGEVAPYDAPRIAAAMDRLSDPAVQRTMRANAGRMAAFSDSGVVDWLAASIAQGLPADSRFEDAFAGYSAALR